MKLRNALAALAAVTVLAGAGVGVAFLSAPNPASANETALEVDEIIDQQTAATNDEGRIFLDFRNGEEHQRCLASRADHISVTPVRNTTVPGNAPVAVQAAHNEACTVILTPLNKHGERILEENVRFTYRAVAVDEVDVPEPEPTSTPE